MPVFLDYRYTGWHIPSPGSWSAIVPDLERRHPTPIEAPPLLSPSKEDVAEIGASPSQIWWSVRCTGHGTEAEMAVRWYLRRKPLTKILLKELSEFTTRRTHLVMSVFTSTKTIGEFTHLIHRPFFPLLDPTEKATMSYFIGCGLAGLSGPAALKVRIPATLKIKRLFHASLYRAHVSLLNTAVVDTLGTTEPDFIGFDELHRIHVFEAKASFVKTDYSYIATGFQQLSPVNGIRFPNPPPGQTIPAASLNVCFTFHSSTAVKQWPHAVPPVSVAAGTRCAVFEYRPTLEQVSPSATPLLKKLQLELLGLQIFGLWISLLSYERLETKGHWSIYRFGGVEDTAVAIPVVLQRVWDGHMESFLIKVLGNRSPELLVNVLIALAEALLRYESEEGLLAVLPENALPMFSWQLGENR